MKIKKIAAATLLPAAAVGAVAGFTLSAGSAQAASPAHPASSAPHQTVVNAKVHSSAARGVQSTAVDRALDAALGNSKHSASSGTRTAASDKASSRAAKQSPARYRAPARTSQAGPAAAPTQQVSVSQPLTAGMSSFERCVAWRESSNTPTDPDGLFGILPSTWAELGYSGTAGHASVALQKVAFNRLYAQYGAQPWAPSDGC